VSLASPWAGERTLVVGHVGLGSSSACYLALDPDLCA